MVGDLVTEAHLCDLFTSLSGIIVNININYQHAAEHVFPQATHDAFNATKWVGPPISVPRHIGVDR